MQSNFKLMTLITSISGIRGTIGGAAGEGLTPIDIVKFTAAYGTWLKKKHEKATVIIGRDARLSGEMVRGFVCETLISLGIDVIDLGLSTTPTVEMAVTGFKAQGGIIITASHNPKQWNALKLLNNKGEFISAKEGETILKLANKGAFDFSEINNIGIYKKDKDYIERHIDEILKLPLVDVEAIKKKKFKVVIDCVNSTGGIAVPELLSRLGVEDVVELFCAPNGRFPHNPEPLPENLTTISNEVDHLNAHLGIVVDPDVDRLALVCEDGSMFGEEYTLVSIADYILQHKKGDTVSNLSSTRALKDVTEKHKCKYHASAVGEVNVVAKMKKVKAVIGGEGNGGIILPELHYGRDALVGIALFLSHLAKSGKSCSALRASYPSYVMFKTKMELTPEIDLDSIFSKIEEKYIKEDIDTTDGLKINFDTEWVHLRKSNTEPIIRIYAESQSETVAQNLTNKIKQDIKELITE